MSDETGWLILGFFLTIIASVVFTEHVPSLW